MKLQGKLSIVRIQRDDDYLMRLGFRDESSGTHFLKVDISAQDLLLAIASLADRPIEFEMMGCDRVGKQQEMKHEIVTGITPIINKEAFRKRFAELVSPFEVDGWKADMESSFNHRKETKEGYPVTFRRYVGEGLGYEKVNP